MAREKNGGIEIFAKITRWTSFVGACLTLLIGIIHVCTIGARIYWPDKFIDDINRHHWRLPLFSFIPEVFIDAWTPTVFGLVGMACHFEMFKAKMLTATWVYHFIFQFIMGLFATMPYEGGLGILCSVVTWLVCLFCLILAFLHDGPASLDLSLKCNFKLKDKGGAGVDQSAAA